jgi:drug/metabolite transporter (DMT)-like permease
MRLRETSRLSMQSPPPPDARAPRVRGAAGRRPRAADITGVLLAAGSAVSFGVTVVAGRSLATSTIDPATALGFRFTVAAAVVAVVLAVRRVPLLPAPGERLAILALGAVVYTGQATLFYLGLQRGTAAATALLFYAYPALVTVIELALRWVVPSPRILVALGLSAAGTVLVVASGDRVSISGAGALMALGAAGIFALYLLGSSRFIVRSSALTQAGWVATGAAVSSFARAVVTHGVSVPPGQWPALAVYGGATASAFTFLFMALPRLGASRLAVVMTLEAFSAVVLGALFLGETLTAAQAAGGVAILAATVTVAGGTGSGRPGPIEELETAPGA